MNKNYQEQTMEKEADQFVEDLMFKSRVKAGLVVGGFSLGAAASLFVPVYFNHSDLVSKSVLAGVLLVAVTVSYIVFKSKKN